MLGRLASALQRVFGAPSQRTVCVFFKQQVSGQYWATMPQEISFSSAVNCRRCGELEEKGEEINRRVGVNYGEVNVISADVERLLEI